VETQFRTKNNDAAAVVSAIRIDHSLSDSQKHAALRAVQRRSVQKPKGG
jgi:hypothetical protein